MCWGEMSRLVLVCVADSDWSQDAMLREFQEEIKRLKEQLDATQRGVMIDADGKVRGPATHGCSVFLRTLI